MPQGDKNKRWKEYTSKNDFERELAERGQEDSKFLDSFLFRYSFKKHKILCSTSIRTLQTYQNLKFSLNEKKVE